MADNATASNPVSVTKISDHIRGLTSWDDATWILTSSFIIFTMQSGFGLLESGFAHRKNEVNVMAKNVADVTFGGLSYWMLGYGLSFGSDPGSNPFCGVGRFFLNPDDETMGAEFSMFVFQSSFATTATTIVSGALAERTKFMAYVVFSFLNTFIYCFPAHWVWAPNGWLNQLGVVDVAGCGPVHIVGGCTALVAAILVKPRARRFTPQDDHTMGSPVTCLLGTFILWWGWLAFNCGSTYGISDGKWKIAARSAATTLVASCGGGATAFIASYLLKNRIFDISMIINGILGSLVAITGICGVTGTWEALVIGATAALVPYFGELLLIKLKIDDPVGAFPVHGLCGVWGLLCAGIFTHKDIITNVYALHSGLSQGGGWRLMGLQTLAAVSISAWSLATSFIFLKMVDLVIGLRVSPEAEELGADLVEHNVHDRFALPLSQEASSSALTQTATSLPAQSGTSHPAQGGTFPSEKPDSCCCLGRRRRRRCTKKVTSLPESHGVRNGLFIISDSQKTVLQEAVSSQLCLLGGGGAPVPEM